MSQRFAQLHKDVLVPQEVSLAKHREHQGRELEGREDAYVIMRQGTATQVCRD